nr:uncharacterized protein LOC120964345 [Aegilops tauschii subsp. strangulata]XP_045084308.1 uncharacterized protein LOC120964345 [Aegilops tauschii subsp. strangulata]XP_045084309.1 uncharacterized protein LOC120964345 [Aegilops tauschii subsp. strangulata]XP_045084310.1 uncharacterized protein LOC120964345 [Aegilops tauschii subsp. strangulata]XP_045084311.1 uncharacterized protein LOC120964345 [Aegilops tauschii subsp. strangulata]XP_045084312.1 uncharacterized protein LOC120964345 [Aegilop
MGGVNRRVSIGGAMMQASKTDILYTKNVHAAKRSEDIAHLSPGNAKIFAKQSHRMVLYTEDNLSGYNGRGASWIKLAKSSTGKLHFRKMLWQYKRQEDHTKTNTKRRMHELQI